jgi:ribose transport system substrate-binding protein
MKGFAKYVVALALIACISLPLGAEARDNKFQGSSDETYYMCVFVSGVDYWFSVYETMKDAGRQLGVKTVYSGTPEYDVNKQLAVFEQIIAKKPKGIFLSPMNSDAFIDPINRAVAQGIAVVTFASDSPNSLRQAYITADDVRGGGRAAGIMTIENPGQDNHMRYIQGFIDQIAGKYKSIKVATRLSGLQDVNKAYNGVMAAFQAHPEIRAIIMPDGNSGLGAAKAAKELNKSRKADEKILVFCRDTNPELLEMIRAGDVYGAMQPSQGMQGYFGMLALFAAAHPQLVDPMNDYSLRKANPVDIPFIDNGYTMINSGNVDYYDTTKYIKKRGSKGINE